MPCGEFDDILKENGVHILSPVSAKYQKNGYCGGGGISVPLHRDSKIRRRKMK